MPGVEDWTTNPLGIVQSIYGTPFVNCTNNEILIMMYLSQLSGFTMSLIFVKMHTIAIYVMTFSISIEVYVYILL